MLAALGFSAEHVARVLRKRKTSREEVRAARVAVTRTV
jgi:hypothetical protein